MELERKSETVVITPRQSITWEGDGRRKQSAGKLASLGGRKASQETRAGKNSKNVEALAGEGTRGQRHERLMALRTWKLGGKRG